MLHITGQGDGFSIRSGTEPDRLQLEQRAPHRVRGASVGVRVDCDQQPCRGDLRIPTRHLEGKHAVLAAFQLIQARIVMSVTDA